MQATIKGGKLIARQKEIDDSIARNAKPNIYMTGHMDNSKVRVAGPFTVESLSPHKVIAVDDDGEFLPNLMRQMAFMLPWTAVKTKLILAM